MGLFLKDIDIYFNWLLCSFVQTRYHYCMTDKKTYSLIIFDCDGTLADTEPACNKVLSDSLMDLGLTDYTPEKCMDTFIGTALPAIMDMVTDKYGTVFPDDYIERDSAKIIDMLETHMTLDPTTDGVLKALFESDIKIAVGSNGMRQTVLGTLNAAKYDQYFSEDRVFTFSDVARPKPAPDLYLHVCSQMGVDPQETLVIEDTVKGAMGGINANIDVVGYTGLTHRESVGDRLRVAGCKYMTQSMAELLGIVGL